MDPLTSVREGYDRWAAVYDNDGNPLLVMEGAAVREALGTVQDRAALDLGCGTGRHALWLAHHGAQVTALDFSPGMLAQAQRQPGADQVRWLVHDLHDPLPLAEASFDLVVSGLVLEHLRDLPALFAEIRRVLKPAGRAVISAMHPAMFLRGSQARFTDPDSGNIVQPGSIAHSVADIVMAAIHTGFQLKNLIEQAPDVALAARYPRAEKYVGWPMLVMLSLAAV